MYINKTLSQRITAKKEVALLCMHTLDVSFESLRRIERDDQCGAWSHWYCNSIDGHNRVSNLQSLSLTRPQLLKLTAQRLHGDHVLKACHGQLYNLENGFTHALDGLYTDGERQQEHVEPGDEESQGPGEEPEDEEPENGPQYSRA